MVKKFFLAFIIIFNINLFAADYDDDAAIVDFYVPGVLANDSVSQVNFLLCFLANTNFGTFTNAGPYRTLIDEASCRTADGSDSTAEKAQATGTSSENETGDATAIVEEVTYSPGILNVTSDANGTLTGNGWMDIIIDLTDTVSVASTAYVQTVLTADKNEAAGRPYGNFTMTYEIKTTAEASFNGINLPIGYTILQGYLDILGNTIKYYEDGPFFTPQSIMGDVTNTKKDGYLISNVRKFSGNNFNDEDIYQVRYKVFQDDVNKVYCQRFEKAVKYTQTASGLVASETEYADTTAFNAEIAGAFTNPATAALQTQGGTLGTITDEHCWSTDVGNATRQIYQYGTYLNSTGARYDLENTSLSLEANTTDNTGLTRPIHAHASYYGTHVRDSDVGNLTNTTIFKNQRNSSDTDSYTLEKNYYQVYENSSSLTALNQLNGVSFQWHVKHFKDPNSVWFSKIGSSGFNWPTSGACDAATGNCPEYSGTISVSGSNVTFTATHGMDWEADIQPFKLDTALTFTAAAWVEYMTQNTDWNETMHFHNPDSRESYRVPYAAFQNVTSSLVKIATKNKVDIDSLDGKTFICVERCLGATKLNAALAEAFTKVDDNADPAVLDQTPFVNNGPYFKVASYYDGNGNGNQDGGEDTKQAGKYNDIGGVIEDNLTSYTVTNSQLVGDSADGGTIEWTDANKEKLNFSKYREGIRDYQYKIKEPSYTEDTHTWTYGHSFHMNAVEIANKNNIKCDLEGNNSRYYTNRYRAVSNDNPLLVAGDSYYCADKVDDGTVTSYQFKLKKRPDFRIKKAGQVVAISAPKSYEYTVPANIDYNFPNTDLEGNTYTFKFEGFGELHNLPGRVYDTCNGVEKGRYVDNWVPCYRFISEFTLPDGAILYDKLGSDDIKVRALRGDEYLKKISVPSDTSYTKNFSDLPTADDLVAVSTIIGNAPTTGIINNGNVSVIHGDTVFLPNQ